MKLDPIADTKLHSLRTSTVQKFIDRLEGEASVVLTRKIRTTMRGIVKYGLSRDFLRVDPVVATTVSKRPATDIEDGGDRFPTKAELKSLLEVAERRVNQDQGYAMAVLQTLMFCGLRISELRGLTAPMVTTGSATPTLRVVQRADKWQRLGPPKSKTSRRTVPLGRGTAIALAQWMIAKPVGDFHLVFPNGSGNVESYANFWNRFWVPLCGDAGLADPLVRIRKDRNSGIRKQVLSWKPRFGPHALRHAYASMLIENGSDLKRVSALMGHSKVATTLDLYGHLWADDERDNEIANAAERLILGESFEKSAA